MTRPYRDHSPEQLRALLAAPHVGGVAKQRIRDELARRDGTSTVDVPSPAPQRVRAMRLCMPLGVNRTNRASGTGHWSTLHRQDERYRDVLDALARMGAFPAPPPAPYSRVRIRVTIYPWAIMDADNAVARAKAAIDWIVRVGYVVDDTPAHLEWSGMPDQVVDRECPRLVIRIGKPRQP
jgi:hypothetical protein